MDKQMRIICEFQNQLRNSVGANNLNLVGTGLRVVPGIGQPFLVFPSLPGPVAMAHFENFPQYVVSSVISENVAMMQEMLANPPYAGITPDYAPTEE